MRNLLIAIRNSTFSLVVIAWGLILILSNQILRDTTLFLLFTTFTPYTLGVSFISVGILHMISRLWGNNKISAVSDIAIAFIFVIVMMSSLFASFYAISWIAYSGVSIYLVINAFLVLYGDKNEDL